MYMSQVVVCARARKGRQPPLRMKLNRQKRSGKHPSNRGNARGGPLPLLPPSLMGRPDDDGPRTNGSPAWWVAVRGRARSKQHSYDTLTAGMAYLG